VGYKSVMVHVALGRDNAEVLKVAMDLAERFDARIIGVGVGQPVQILYADGYVATEVIEADRTSLAREIGEAEAEFRAALAGRKEKLDWRSAVTAGALADFLAGQARGADLLIAGLQPPGSLFNPARGADPGDLVMRAGRPVLLVPAAGGFALNTAIVAWKESRETRRAVADALPLLRHAAAVTVVEIAAAAAISDAASRLADVKAWLALHGVTAETIVLPAAGPNAEQLEGFATEQRADLIVAGAYGHSRLGEWALGGVTRDYLLRALRVTLVSH
jgi:nucleotide-binding universal stress UspA family protein